MNGGLSIPSNRIKPKKPMGGRKNLCLVSWARSKLEGGGAYHGKGMLEAHDSGNEEGELVILAEEGRQGAVVSPGRCRHAQESPLVVAHNVVLPYRPTLPHR